jgi:anti-sigma B factor antagonist
MTNPHFSVEDYAGILVIKFSDAAILESSAIQQIGQALYQLVERDGKSKLVLDFSGVKILSSHMLGVLLTLKGKVEKSRGAIAVCSLRAELKKVFTITSLDKLFMFYPTDVEALAAFNVTISRDVPDKREEI